MTSPKIADQHATATLNRGVPTLIDPDADLGRKPDGEGTFWTDSIYVTGSLAAGDTTFGYLVHVMRQPTRGAVVQSVSITEGGNGRFRTHQEMLSPADLAWSMDGLDLSTADVSWTGDARAQHLVVSFPFGALDLELQVNGPVLYYAGTGQWPMLGFTQRQYALSDMHAAGTLTLDGAVHLVAGDSWLDRQWGDLPDTEVMRWSWFNLALPGGDKMAVWDIRPAAGDLSVEQAWATVLHPDSTHELLPVTPLAVDAGRNWTSPVTGQTFPTTWTVSVPTRGITLTIVADVIDQELPALGGGIYEGLATVTGSYLGRPVSAKTYVEQVGNWRN